MTIAESESYLRHYVPSDTKISEVYDDDECLANSLNALFPGFEYPDFSHLTVQQAWQRYRAQAKDAV